jgi:hypothetical protein
MAFGALTAGLQCSYSRDGVSFTWIGSDEMDEVSGEGSADLSEDGTLDGEIVFHRADEIQFTACRE